MGMLGLNGMNFRLAIILTLCLFMSHIPEVAFADLAPRMISTQEVVEQMSRAEAESSVRAQLDRQEVQDELVKYGVSAEEAKLRLASLSDAELNDLAQQMNKAQYGGVIGVLVIVVLVLLIIFLAKRI